MMAAACIGVHCAGACAMPADVEALKVAAEGGDARALTELAVRHQHAEGVPKDFEKANALYCRAARQGYAEAQYQLGWNYAYGRGADRDDRVASAFFRMAAGQGHDYAARAMRLLNVEPAEALPACLAPDVAVAAGPERANEPVRMPDDDAQLAGLGRVPADIERLVRQLAPQYSVDSRLVLALISAESAFNPSAVSPKNAQGLMQLIPETAARFGVKRPLNPVENIRGGLAYLRWLLAFFRGNVPLVLAAYNAGEGAVERHRGIPPYAETREYVRKITQIYKRPEHPYEPGVVEPSALVSGAASPKAGLRSR